VFSRQADTVFPSSSHGRRRGCRANGQLATLPYDRGAAHVGSSSSDVPPLVTASLD
jgi:hypothetical protein